LTHFFYLKYLVDGATLSRFEADYESKYEYKAVYINWGSDLFLLNSLREVLEIYTEAVCFLVQYLVQPC
jgi:hypothetical protein